MLENCRMLKQTQLKIFIDLDTVYQHAVEIIVHTYDVIDTQEYSMV